MTEVLRVLVDLLKLFGFDDSGYSNAKDLDRWRQHSAASGGWMKWAKYKLAAFFAFHADQELPKCPAEVNDHPGMLLGGTAGRFIRKILKTDKFWPFLTSVLQSKKGMPRPTADQVAESVKETQIKLTTGTPVQQYAWMSGRDKKGGEMKRWLGFEELKVQCRKVVREVFKGKRFANDDLLTAFMPSLSANYNNTRSKLGTFGELVDQSILKGYGWTEKSPMTNLPLFETKIQFSTRDLSVGADNFHYERLPFVRQAKTRVSRPSQFEVQTLREEAREPVVEASEYTMRNYDLLKSRFTQLYFDVLKRARDEKPYVVPVGLAEALKVRVISKGPPMTYFCLKPIQKFMWSVLANHPTFQLVGKPVDASMLEEVLGFPTQSKGYVSGDYKAATDNIRWELTETVWDELCNICQFPAAIRLLGQNALTEHIFIGDEGEELIQRSGQLMGSIISFPILCIINAAVCRWSMVLTDYPTINGREPTLRQLPLLINGDDCAFTVSQRCFETWKRIAEMAGLETSVGKTYYSDKFVNINSTNFVLRTVPVPELFDSYRELQQVPYLNLGLMYGLKRSGGAVGALDTDLDLGSRQRELFRLAGDLIPHEALHKIFLRRNDSALSLFRENRIPFYIPKEYGGVGLQPIGDYQPSTLDLKIVRSMINQLGPQPLPLREPAKLVLHQACQEVLRCAGVQTQPRWVIDNGKVEDPLKLEPMYLWTLMMIPDLVAQTTSEDAAMELIRTNRKIWDWYTHHASKLLPAFDVLLPRKLVHNAVISYNST